MGITRGVQFNPSTLKAIYNPATNKVQRFYKFTCIPAPTITMVFSGINDCGLAPPSDWDSDPNLTYDDFDYISDTATHCYYKDGTSSQHWNAVVFVEKATGNVAIDVSTPGDRICFVYGWDIGSGGCRIYGPDNPASNELAFGQCGDLTPAGCRYTINGHSGQCTYTIIF